MEWKISSGAIQLLLLFFTCSLSTLEGEETPNIINSEGLSSLKWGQHLLKGEKSLLLPENYTHVNIRGKRYVSLGNTDGKKNKSYQACIAPGDKKGHCRHLNNCVLEEFTKDFAKFLDYMCIIEQSYVGVCCPDDAKESAPTTPAMNENFVGSLPAVADVDEEKPIWDTSESNSEKKSEEKEMTREPRGPRGCGMSSKSRIRIVGGRPADPREWPWMVALIRTDADHYCGGVLITDRHVLTAAHCVHGIKQRNIIVRLGEYDFAESDETRALDFRILDVIKHPYFDPVNYDHDIAIIKIHRPTVFNTYIWPICLPPVDSTYENKSAIVTGWGTQYWGGPVSSILMEVAVPVWPHDKCRRAMVTRIAENTICAGAYEGGRDSCQGDSGGPLLHQLGNGRWVNIGIVSWGIRCGEAGHPGIYTRVSSYLDWIFANAVF